MYERRPPGWAHRSCAPTPVATAVAPKPDQRPSEAGEVIALNTVRLQTGERLAENWRTIPHVFQAIEVDFTAIDRVAPQAQGCVPEAHGFSLTYLPFIARATCLALQAFPHVNARFDGKALDALA